MTPCEKLSRKLDELESEIDLLGNPKDGPFPHPRAAAIQSKLKFLQNLLAAETVAASAEVAARLSRAAGRVSSLCDPKTEAIEHEKNVKPVLGIEPVLLRKNLEELESMANALPMDSPQQPPWLPNMAKILSKIYFTKSLLAAEAPNEELSSMRARLSAVEEAFGRLDTVDATPPPCSRASSCHTEEVEEDVEAMAPWLVASRRKIEDLEHGISGDGYDDAGRKIRFCKSLLAAEMNWKVGDKSEDFDCIVKRFSSIESEFANQNGFFGDEDDAIGGNLSSPCSCTSSCFDGGEEKEKSLGEEEQDFAPDVNEAEEASSPETVEAMGEKPETADSGMGVVEVAESGGGRRFGKLRALGSMAGVFAVAVAGVVVGSFFMEVKPVYLVPT